MIGRARANWRLKLCGIATLALGQFSAPAVAQSSAGGTLSTASLLPALDSAYLPKGIVLGSVTVFPVLGVAGTYDDNIYNTNNSVISDEYFSIKPTVRALGSLGLTNYSVQAGGDIERFVNTPTENSATYNFGIGTQTSFASDMALRFNGSFARQTEARGSAGDIFIGGRPVAYQLATASASITRSVNRLRLQLAGNFSNFVYDRAHINGLSIDQRQRDYRSYGGQARVEYVVGPEVGVFVTGAYNASDYTANVGVNRNSHGYSFLTGIHFEATDLIFLDAGIGYISETFASNLFPGVSGLNYSLSLNWSITPLTTISASANRTVERSPIVGVAGISEQVGTFGVTHQLLRNLILSANAKLVNDTYKGQSRTDTRVSATASARYAVTPDLVIELNYGYRNQSSDNLLGRRYSGNSLGLTVRVLR